MTAFISNQYRVEKLRIGVLSISFSCITQFYVCCITFIKRSMINLFNVPKCIS